MPTFAASGRRISVPAANDVCADALNGAIAQATAVEIIRRRNIGLRFFAA
jgi:hypothetical protein